MSIPMSSTNSKNVSEKEDEYASLKDIEFQNENSFVENEGIMSFKNTIIFFIFYCCLPFISVICIF